MESSVENITTGVAMPNSKITRADFLKRKEISPELEADKEYEQLVTFKVG